MTLRDALPAGKHVIAQPPPIGKQLVGRAILFLCNGTDGKMVISRNGLMLANSDRKQQSLTLKSNPGERHPRLHELTTTKYGRTTELDYRWQLIDV